MSQIVDWDDDQTNPYKPSIAEESTIKPYVEVRRPVLSLFAYGAVFIALTLIGIFVGGFGGLVVALANAHPPENVCGAYAIGVGGAGLLFGGLIGGIAGALSAAWLGDKMAKNVATERNAGQSTLE